MTESPPQPDEKQVGSNIKDFVMTPVLFPGQMVPYEEMAKKRLENPNLLEWIREVLSQRIVGEDDCKVLLFLVALSYKTDEPQNCIFSGPPSTGKSYLCKNVLRLMPNVINVSRMTPAFLDRIGSDLSHYILYVSELGGAEQSLPILRVMLSEGELVLGTTERNDKGKIETMIVETKGSPPYITTTNQEIVERQLASRTWLQTVDTTPEQTRRVIRYQAKLARSAPLPEYTPEEMVLRTLVYMLKPNKVMVPFTEKLGELFPSTEVQARRDFNRLLSLIKVVTLLYQRQRLHVKVNGEDYLLASLQDLAHALRLITPVLLPTLYGLPQKAFELLKTFQEPPHLELEVKDVGAKAQLSDNRVREILNGLVDRGFLHKNTGSKPYKYQWTGKTLESGTILSIVDLAGFFSQTDFEKWLNENGTTYAGDSKDLYATYILPRGLLSSEPVVHSEDKPESTVLEENKLERPTMEPIVPNSKSFTAITLDNILGWLRLEFQQGNNPILEGPKPLEPIIKGKCPLCQQFGNLTHQVQFVNGDRIDALCLVCCRKIDDLIAEFRAKPEGSAP